jgi:hypothetical protein
MAGSGCFEGLDAVVRQSMAVFFLHLSSRPSTLREIPRQSETRRRATSFAVCWAMCLLQFIRRPFRVLESRSAGQTQWGLVGSVDRDVESLQGRREQSSGRMISGFLLTQGVLPTLGICSGSSILLCMCLGHRGNVPARRDYYKRYHYIS